MRHNRRGLNRSSNLIIEMPDDLARSLEGIASTQHKTVRELAVERLRSLVEGSLDPQKGSPGAVLRAMREPPHPSASDVEELEAAIGAGRVPAQTRHLFSD